MLPTLSSSHLSLLSHNSQHIFVAAHKPGAKPLKLTPALIGNKLYCPSSGLHSRLLNAFYVCWTKLFGDNLVNHKLAKAVKATQKCFSKLEMSRRAHHDAIYQDYLDNRFNGQVSRFSGQEVELARKQIKRFYSSTYPLSRLVRQKSNGKLNDFLNIHFEKSMSTGRRPFYSASTFKKVKGFVRMMALEGMIGGELPLHVFYDEAPIDPTKLKKQDVESLKTFVEKIALAKKQGRFQIELFHSALKSLLKILKNSKAEEHSLTDVEELLIQEGCIFLQEFDKDHISWRNGLSSGSTFKNEEAFYYLDSHEKKHELTLGQRLDSYFHAKDHYHVYEVYTDERKSIDKKRLLIIPPNKICLEFMELMRLKTFWGLDMPTVSYIHPSGKYAVIEKLPQAITDIEWKSDLLGTLHEDDRSYADPLKILMQFFTEENNSPQNFSTDIIKFDRKGVLKTTKALIPCGKVDYLALEKFIYNTSQGSNLTIYQHLIEPLFQKSRCKRLNKFFRDCISSAFKNNPYPIKLLAEMRRVDKKAILRGIKLATMAKKMKKPCMEELSRRYLHVDQKNLRKHLRKCLLSLYDKDCTLGRFWKSLEAEDLMDEAEQNLDAFVNVTRS